MHSAYTPRAPRQHARSAVQRIPTTALKEWLDAAKPGFAAEFAAAFADAGYGGKEDILLCPPDLTKILPGANELDRLRMSRAVLDAHFDPEKHSRLAGWLDAVKPGFSRFAAAFVVAGTVD